MNLHAKLRFMQVPRDNPVSGEKPARHLLWLLFYRSFPRRFLLLLFLVTSPHWAHASISHVCDRAGQIAASEAGVPFAVLWSITRTETGRVKGGSLTPWPWTVNMEGKGHWFGSSDAALKFALQNFKRGARSFDVGCFQINYRWHGDGFLSINQMFDPYENARYAANFLAKLYEETGNWSVAAGMYHSRTPEFAKIYRARFDRIHGTYNGDRSPVVVAEAPLSAVKNRHPKPRLNAYPLLHDGGVEKRYGSLVPLSHSGTQSFIHIPRNTGGS